MIFNDRKILFPSWPGCFYNLYSCLAIFLVNALLLQFLAFVAHCVRGEDGVHVGCTFSVCKKKKKEKKKKNEIKKKNYQVNLFWALLEWNVSPLFDRKRSTQHITYILYFAIHSVEIYQFSCQTDFTWNQFFAIVCKLKDFCFSFQKMAKWSSQHNGKFPDPYSKIKLDEEKKVKKKKKKKEKDRESILNQIDPNTNKVSLQIYIFFVK